MIRGLINQSIIALVALFVFLPVYRPILVAINAVPIIYVIFILAFLVVLKDVRVISLTKKRFSLLMILFLLSMAVSSLVAVADVQEDLLGLLFFLMVSFYLGSWLVYTDGVHRFFRFSSIIFLPVTFYVLWQLLKNGFSYNTYFYWSAAAFKIDYLTFSLYASFIALFFVLNGKGYLEKYFVPIFLLSVLLMSGARYSIIATLISMVIVGFSKFKEYPPKIVVASLVVILVVVFILVEGSVVERITGALEYSLYRLLNLFGDDNSVASRFVLLDRSEKIIFENFVFGVGVGNSASALGGTYPHNFLLEAFIDGGFLAALSALLFFVCVSHVIFSSNYSGKVWAVLVFFYMVGAFLKSFSLYESRVLFFVAGMSVAYQELGRYQSKKRGICNEG